MCQRKEAVFIQENSLFLKTATFSVPSLILEGIFIFYTAVVAAKVAAAAAALAAAAFDSLFTLAILTKL